MKKALFLATLLLPLALAAQTFTGLRSEGPLPNDLKQSYEELLGSDLDRARDYVGGKVRDKGNLQQAAYYISKMMAGGRILYGDPVTRMVERIADTLLANHPDLRKELRFYTVLSPDVNAFATAQGMVFVNVGLVAQVEDEAQLAFILSHEIIHYSQRHGLEELLGKKDKSKDGMEELRTELNEFLRRHSRSREMETEADSMGIACFYQHSPYSKDVAQGVFDVLQYSALPFDDMPFDREFLNTTHYRMGDDCWLDSVAPITSRDDYDDSRSTHPNLLKRRTQTGALLEHGSGNKRFVTISREEFLRLQRMARYECVRQEIIYGQYARAFYESYLLCQLDSTDATAHRLLAQSLYSVAKFRSHGITDKVGNYKSVEGEVQQCYYMLRRIDSKQLTLLAINKLWQLGRRFPGDNLYGTLAADLAHDLYTKFDMRHTDFLATPPTADTAAAETQPEEKTMTKYERIKKKRTVHTSRNPMSYAFTDIMSHDSTFNRMLRQQMAPIPASPTLPTATADTAQFVFSPTYRILNSKTGNIKSGKSIGRERNLTNQIRQTGRRFGISTIDFSDQCLSATVDADRYNDFITINEWISEFWQTKGEFNIMRLTQPSMDALADRYGTSRLNLTAVLNLENSKTNPFGGMSWYLWPLAPVEIYNYIADREQTSVATMVVDTRAGKVLSRGEYQATHDDTPTLLRSALYDSYRKIEIDRKAKSPEQAEKRKKSLVSGIEGRRFALTAGMVPMLMSPYIRLAGGAEFAFGKTNSIAFNYLHNTDAAFSTSFSDVKTPLYPTYLLSYRSYTRTDFAPLGHYWGAGVSLTNDKLDKRHLGVGVEFGRNYVWWGRMVLNLNFRYGITFSKWDDDQLFERALANFLTLYIGLGVLPF